MIHAKDISFYYTEGKQVLQNISFNLEKGKTLAIVGASGCGKSTLLRILSGILTNYKGDISIDGLTPDLYRQTGKLAFMFQESTLMPHLTVKQNIELPLKIKGNTDEQKINNLIKAVGLEEYANCLPKQLSGGMKTRVALARSFSTNPELLLLDEPFSALDIAWKSKLYVELEKLKEQNNTTVVIVTHDVQEAILLANSVVILGKDGFIIEREDIISSVSIMERITNISHYNGTENFQNLYSSVQKWILNDAVRNITSKNEVEQIIEQIINVAGVEKEEKKLNDLLVGLYGYTNDEKNHNLLFTAFLRGTPYLKNELIWDILAYEQIDDEKVSILFNYYYTNIEEVSTQAKESFYKLEANKIFNKLTEKINRTNLYKKKWVYLLDMYASSETEKVISYLTQVENGEIGGLNYELAKEVAQKVKEKVKAKIKNEKQDTLHIA